MRPLDDTQVTDGFILEVFVLVMSKLARRWAKIRHGLTSEVEDFWLRIELENEDDNGIDLIFFTIEQEFIHGQ